MSIPGDLYALAQHALAAAREIADIDAFHLLVVHRGEPLPMHYVLFADREKDWPGRRHTPEECLRDSLALKLRHTVGGQPSPYGAAFDIYPSQLYVPILDRSAIRPLVSASEEDQASAGESGLAYRASDEPPPFEEVEPIGVLSPKAAISDFFTPELRTAYESLAADLAPPVVRCLRSAG